jgi:hypothetical protein
MELLQFLVVLSQLTFSSSQAAVAVEQVLLALMVVAVLVLVGFLALLLRHSTLLIQ